MTREPVRIGLVGCGVISGAYLRNLKADPAVDVVACADIDEARAGARAEEFSVPRVLGVSELLEDPAVEVVLNLTWPKTHAELNLAALERGKHVFTEKPLAISLEDGRRTLDEAQRRNLRVGCAPDTILADGAQTARKLLDEGEIGSAVGAGAWYLLRHPARWHPAPEFLYEEGAGPLMDIGPYLVTTLVSLLGPVRRVAGSSRVVSSEMTIGQGPNAGTVFPVHVPTWSAALIDFEGGATAQLVTTWETSGEDLPNVQIWGSTGVIWVTDPNGFGETARIRRSDSEEPEVVEATHRNARAGGNQRGLGLREMARAIREDRPHRLQGELAYHVLEVMMSIEESSREGRHVPIQSTCQRPEPMPEEMR
jgi:predicted dehydrogenase